MGNVFTSSIGKKLIMSISGLFLVIFLLLHLTINFFSVVDACTGNFAIGNEEGLFALGCRFMASPIITIMVPILALGFVIHICYACYLTYGNIKARGGYFRYAGGSKAVTESWAARNMFVLGIIVIGFILFHLTHFWQHMQLQELVLGNEPDDPYFLLMNTFRHWWVVVLYIIWFGALWFHLSHGFWSAFQTIGWSNSPWEKRLKWIGYIFATIIAVGMTVVAINACVQAQSHTADIQAYILTFWR